MIKAGATQTETSFLKQYAAGERVDLLDDYDFPARTITEASIEVWTPLRKAHSSFLSFFVIFDVPFIFERKMVGQTSLNLIKRK